MQAEHSRLLLATLFALGNPLVLADSHTGHSTKPSTRKERVLQPTAWFNAPSAAFIPNFQLWGLTEARSSILHQASYVNVNAAHVGCIALTYLGDPRCC